MLGAIVGDIIGSPYRYANAEDKYFDIGKSVRSWVRGREMTFHPEITANVIFMYAVSRWLTSDRQRRTSSLIRQLQDTISRYTTPELAYFIDKWVDSDKFQSLRHDTPAAMVAAIPAARSAQTLPEAISIARQVAEVFSTDPKAIEGSMALGQAIWMAAHGRSKEDISFAMENDFGLTPNADKMELHSRLLGAKLEPIIINGEETGEYYLRETGKRSNDTDALLNAALHSFIKGEDFEDTARRAVALGGHSDTVTCIAGALAEAFHGKVPEKLKGLCTTYCPAEIRSQIISYEAICLNKSQQARTTVRKPDNSFNVIRMPDQGRIFSVPSYRKDIIDAVKARFGEDVRIMKPTEAQALLKEVIDSRPGGTYLVDAFPDVRTLYFQDGQIQGSVSIKGEHMPSADARRESRQDFCQIADFAEKVRTQLQAKAGYHGDGCIHFENAYFPIVGHDKVEVWKGDLFAGSIGIDPSSGLLKLNHGGDFGPMEWFGERTDSVFNSVTIESVKQALSQYCLDEGRGIYDSNRPLNVEVANNDVAKSNDTKLQQAIESQSQTQSKSVKVK